MKWDYNSAFQRHIICVCILFGCDFMTKKLLEIFKKSVKSMHVVIILGTKHQ
jgi:ethanolamine transporter EutH